MYGTVDLDAVAERFDALYTQMTVLQRELIAAQRDGAAGQRLCELADRVDTFVFAYRASDSAMSVGQQSIRDAEAAALRQRVLRPPIDEHLLLAALKTLGRPHAFALLADAIQRAADADALETAFGARTVGELLGASRGMGAGTARPLAEHLGLDPDAPIAEIDRDDLDRLYAGLHDAAGGLPDAIRDWRRRGVKAPDDGAGAGPVVLSSWVEAIGAPTDSARAAAVAAAERTGWPPDAVAVAEALVTFTHDVLAPALIDDWERIAQIADEQQRLSAMRAQATAWRSSGEEDGFVIAWALDRLITAIKTCRKARRLADGSPQAWGSSTPLALARSSARRCGELLSLGEQEPMAELVGRLPELAP
jgi:hypothetical protein